MKIYLFLILALFSDFTYGQSYEFLGKMKSSTLSNFLERSITMQTISDIEGHGNQPEMERVKDIIMLNNIDAKFIHRLVGWWENAYVKIILNYFLVKLNKM